MQGSVKVFFVDKGWGFIRPSTSDKFTGERDKDVFVHISAVERAGLRTLVEGQLLEFEVESNPKTGRQCAERLRLL
jgi:CspA family cold shock protein